MPFHIKISNCKKIHYTTFAIIKTMEKSPWKFHGWGVSFKIKLALCWIIGQGDQGGQGGWDENVPKTTRFSKM